MGTPHFSPRENTPTKSVGQGAGVQKCGRGSRLLGTYSLSPKKNILWLCCVFTPPGSKARLKSRNLRLNKITRIFPCIESTQYRVDVFETMVEQDARRTGAGMFVKSGTVGNDPLCGVKFVQAGFDFCQ